MEANEKLKRIESFRSMTAVGVGGLAAIASPMTFEGYFKVPIFMAIGAAFAWFTHRAFEYVEWLAGKSTSPASSNDA